MRPAVSYAILCDGDFPENADVRDRLLSCDVVVCCDGAAGSFMRFRKPEFVVGDMDSLPETLRQELSDQIFPVGEQESNDLSKAFRWICSMLRVGRGTALPEFSITVFGATGKREDHTLGNISLLADFAFYLDALGARGSLSMVTDYGVFVPLLDSCRLGLPVGQPLSLFAFDPELRIDSSGLEYPTSEVRFDMWWKATLNRTSSTSVELRLSHPAKVLAYLPGFMDGQLNVEKL
ncbi:MAG TPA: thiamine diphosphokinase [Candidatus Coprenecus pullistercoris]|nr:thiamine diphosphokinase [Candidatus Coprenecus pullistercoris]